MSDNPHSPARADAETAATLLLLGAAALAALLANSPWARAWHGLLEAPLGPLAFARLETPHAWISDGLMAVFFFTVGLEIKREALAGQLASAAQRRLPVIAAGTGMLVPALIYLAISHAQPALQRGWAIPAATDIAFAVGVLALARRGVPPGLRLLLLSVAIVDDLGAVAIIALAYSGALDWHWLGTGALVLGGLAALNRLGVKAMPVYLGGAVLLWLALLRSGVHPTIAGVLAALTVPLALDAHGHSPLLRLEHALTPLCAFGIVPLFALANAGVSLGSIDTSGGPGTVLVLAVGLGLLLGKPAGIMGAVLAARRFGFAALPAGTTLRQLWGMALLAGIGFTMSLFIDQLAFPQAPALVDAAKLGVLGGSLLAALGGWALLQLPAKAD